MYFNKSLHLFSILVTEYNELRCGSRLLYSTVWHKSREIWCFCYFCLGNGQQIDIVISSFILVDKGSVLGPLTCIYVENTGQHAINIYEKSDCKSKKNK